MRKIFLNISVMLALSVATTPVMAGVADNHDVFGDSSLYADTYDFDYTQTDVRLVVSGHTLHIIGAEGKRVDIYDTAGNLVFSAEVDCHDKTVNISGRGIFIVKIDQLARKVQIK